MSTSDILKPPPPVDVDPLLRATSALLAASFHPAEAPPDAGVETAVLAVEFGLDVEEAHNVLRRADTLVRHLRASPERWAFVLDHGLDLPLIRAAAVAPMELRQTNGRLSDAFREGALAAARRRHLH